MSTEQTFRDYTPTQGKHYALNRLDYHQALYNFIIQHHTSTGGQLEALIDVGCGPGNVARNLSGHFKHTIGLDPSEGMIETARELALPLTDSSGDGEGRDIRFEVSNAESLGLTLSPPIKEGTIDLITAATAAHWFDMPSFWTSASRVLKPGGSVMIWGSANIRVDPNTPNAGLVQERIDKFEEDISHYFLPGNRLTRGLYKDLVLPWNCTPKIEGFREEGFFRRDWDDTREFHAGEVKEVGMDAFESMMETFSPVTRWREDHPTAKGEEDLVRVFRRDVERLLREGGMRVGEEKLRGSAQGFLIVLKKD